MMKKRSLLPPLPWAWAFLVVVGVWACSSGAGVEAAPPSAGVSQAPAGFWDHWGDGQAEIDTYALVQPRYGEKRQGEAVLIFVTETFTDQTRVKSDGGHDDEFPVIKLNEVRDFQTGLYDYNAMTSSFLRLDGGQPRGQPTKVSLSVQEWCGHVYDQLLLRGARLHRTLHSYFDGEADLNEQADVPRGAVFADAMPLLVRGLVGDLLQPGEQREVPWLPSLLDSRLAHRSLEWRTATLSRTAAPEVVEVPLGSFSCERYTASVDGTTQTWWVEVDAPHRLVKWARSSGEEGSLLGSTRTKYWSQAGEGHERLRVDLGLPEARWPRPGKAGSEQSSEPSGSGQ
ncbi:MAG TPA: hypothetical protein DIU15_05750 [Deltaproteobacteria bacterium]|nr:hypothetical protein [Deltaproteobacteria bacterium]HCP45522.1 hypothetical protein [Deltaproteobacteria bacterium]